jgi:2-polyprenyl-6-methoxyphenol hydroxylase-like FAD-dependent oxidoreductase
MPAWSRIRVSAASAWPRDSTATTSTSTSPSPSTNATTPCSYATRATASYIDPTGDRVLRQSLPTELYDLFRATAGYPPLRIVKLDDQLNETRVLEDDPDATPISADRLTLRQILFEGLSDHVTFGKKLIRYDTSATGHGPVTAHFADGTTATADVLIAADGVNSAVRQQYLPHARIMDSGVRQIYGKVPLDDHTRGLFRDVMFNVFAPSWAPTSATWASAPTSRRSPSPRLPPASPRPTAPPRSPSSPTPSTP